MASHATKVKCPSTTFEVESTTVPFYSKAMQSFLAIVTYLLSSCIVSTHSAIMKGPPPVFKAHKQTFWFIAVLLKRDDVTPVIIGGDGLYCADIVNEFVKAMSPKPVIISNEQNVKALSRLISKPQYIFIFVDFESEIEETLKYSDTYTFWNVRAFMQFVVCHPVKHELWVEPTLKLMWKHKILNGIILYYHNRSYYVMNYDPFTGKLINLSNTNEKNARRSVFNNRLHNMHGYELRVSFFADPPRIVENNGTFYGVDYMILKGFIQRLNATLKLVIPDANSTVSKFKGHITDIVTEKSNFGFVSCFAKNDASFNVTLSYARRMDDVVVLVPHISAVPQFLYVFMVFGEGIWLFVVFSFLAVTTLRFIMFKCLVNKNTTFTSIVMETWGIMFGAHFTLKEAFISPKIIFILWISTCTVLDALFRSLLTSGLVTPKYGHNLNTLAELAANNVTIMLNHFHTATITEQYPRKLIVEKTDEEVMERIVNGDTGSAYAVQMSVAEFVGLKRSSEGHPVFHIIKEHLIPGISVYVFPLNSPYLDEANK